MTSYAELIERNRLASNAITAQEIARCQRNKCRSRRNVSRVVVDGELLEWCERCCATETWPAPDDHDHPYSQQSRTERALAAGFVSYWIPDDA